MTRVCGVTVTVVLAAFFCASDASAGVIWYTAESAGGGWSHLYSIDTTTKAIADRGEVHGQRYITDLAMDAGGELYGVGWNNAYANGTSKLYRITPGGAGDAADWDILQVAYNRMDRTVNAAVMSGEDLYVASCSGGFQKLVRDGSPDRWRVSATGNLGSTSGGDLAFSADGQKLYVTLSGGSLGTVNFDESSRDFGKVTAIGSTGYSQVFGLAWSEEVLYGFTNNNTNYGSSYMVRLNPLTGAASDPVALGVAVWGAAAAGGGANPVPEPATIALLGLGACVALLRRKRTAMRRCC